MDRDPAPDSAYILGHHEGERARLMSRAHLDQRVLERCFEDAGLAAGMTVLDVGCGPGDVMLTAAALVGPTGHIIGVDADPAIIALAQERIAAQGLTNVTFLTGPLESIVLDTTVDAIVGRKILIHLPHPGLVLQRLVAYLRPGGVVAFVENDFADEPIAAPPVPLLADYLRWCREVTLRSGLNPATGRNLHHILLEAGLRAPEQRLECRFFSGRESPEYELAAAVLRGVLPRLLALGIASEAEVGVETFADRLRTQVLGLGAVCSTDRLVSAWARKPLAE